MANIYNAANWYWIGQPAGQSSVIVYSSAAGAVISPGDAAYMAWVAVQGSGGTPWPKDDTGAVTTAALDAVLAATGLPPTGLTALTSAQLLSAASAQVSSLMAVARTYSLSTSPAVSVKCDTLPTTGADLAGLNAWGAANPTATTTWVDDFGAPTTITGAQGASLANQVVAYGQSVYDKLGTVASAIAAGTTTTVVEIAAAGWPT